MFVLAITNMILIGDGKTNFVNEDSFKNSKFKNKATIGFINPPYSKKKDKYKEFDFVERIIDMLNKNKTTELIAIIPLSIISKKDPKFKNARNKILRQHTLKAVISMPDDLFYPVASINTAIVILKPNVPHNSSKKVWMARLKDDGFVKLKHQGRVDKYKRWNIIKKELIDFYKNKEIDNSKFKYIKVKIDQDDDWTPEAYVETDFFNIDSRIFKNKIKDQIVYRIRNDFDLLNDFEKTKKSYSLGLYETEWKEFNYKDVFNLKEDKKNSFTIKRIEKRIVEENPGEIPYVSASEIFHGITAYTSLKDNLCLAPKITLNNSGSVGKSFYHEKNFVGTDSIYAFSIKNEKELDVYVGIFLTTIIELEKYRYNFGRAFRSYRLLKQKMRLPINNKNKINFDFMRRYIKQFKYSDFLKIDDKIKDYASTNITIKK